MIEAERILLRHALGDPLNDRFVFLSDRWGYNFVNNHKLWSFYTLCYNFLDLNYKYSPLGLFVVRFIKENWTEPLFGFDSNRNYLCRKLIKPNWLFVNWTVPNCYY
jgi:hypothetical protein